MNIWLANYHCNQWLSHISCMDQRWSIGNRWLPEFRLSISLWFAAIRINIIYSSYRDIILYYLANICFDWSIAGILYIYIYQKVQYSKNSWTDFLSIPLKGAIFMNFHCFWGAYLSFFSTWFAFCFKLVSRMSTIWQLSEAKFIFAAWFGSIYNGNSLPDIFIRSNQPTQMLCDGIWRDFMASQELFLRCLWGLSKAIFGSDRQE